MQSWGEPCSTPAPVHHREIEDPCGRHSCHHSPCQHGSINRSTHCSHYSACQGACSHMESCRCQSKPHGHVQNPTHPSSEKSRSLSSMTPPLSTDRLKPTRQRTKNAICSILEQGEVCLEFIRMRSGVERIVDVCRISGDGMRVSRRNLSCFFIFYTKLYRILIDLDCHVPTKQWQRSGCNGRTCSLTF